MTFLLHPPLLTYRPSTSNLGRMFPSRIMDNYNRTCHPDATYALKLNPVPRTKFNCVFNPDLPNGAPETPFEVHPKRTAAVPTAERLTPV
jgi:hypothetical protein